ncbi:hypothetical protein Pfo_000361 [Paulownia fortunei]|nr:hypothetical protein Pfo_000361 [Paulownia fortunei]
MKNESKCSKMSGKPNGPEVRKDRKSGSGMIGSPKKGGHGGKFTWAGDGYSRAELGWAEKEAIDSKDPNFEEPETCANRLNRSLVFVGETGYNDIIYAFYEGRSVQEIQTYVPLINQVIINTTRDVIRAGASQIVVPGNFPLGCFPIALSVSRSNDPTAYDDIGCLKSLNNLTTFQNNYLQGALGSLRKEFPNVIILYADYYNTFQSLLRNASTLGFNTTNLLKPCCGVDGQYNPFGPIFCGNLGVPVCSNPNVYIHWDGIHLTQEAYRRMFEILIKDLKINCTQ